MAKGTGKELRGIKGPQSMGTLIGDYEPPSTMSVNMKKHKGMKGVEVGKKVHFQGHGHVTDEHHDGMGHTIHLKIAHIEQGPEKTSYGDSEVK